MANYVGNRLFYGFWLHKLITIHWITVVFLHFVVATDFGPSEDSIRQYLALYKHQKQLQRLKSYEVNPARANYQEEELPREVLERNVNFDRIPQYYKTSENWPEYYRPRTPSDWYSNSQHEIRRDDEAVERQMVETPNLGSHSQSQINDISRYKEKSSNGHVYEEPIKEDKKSSELSSNGGNFPNLPMAHSQLGFETESKNPNPLADIYFVVIVAGCSAAAIFGVIAAGFCFYRIQKNSKAAAGVDYPAYGVTGPSKEHSTSPSGDRRLAHSAQMYHYQHQKQQMIAVEKATTVRNASASDVDSEEENEEGDYTVYECPGLASTGEMEVKNPLFHDDSTPVSPPMTVKETVQKP